MRYDLEGMGWPPYVSYHEHEPLPPVYFDASEPFPAIEVKAVHVRRFEIRVAALEWRYAEEMVVRYEHMVKVEKTVKKSSERDEKLMGKLQALADDRAATGAESDNAKRRIEEVKEKAVEEVVTVEEKRSGSGRCRTQTFIENLEVLSRGICGFRWDEYLGKIKERFFIYARDEDELNRWMEEAIGAADEYRPIPKEPDVDYGDNLKRLTGSR